MPNEIKVPEFNSYEEEADFWDHFDTANYMEDDGEWLQVETDNKRALRVAILPEIVAPLRMSARSKSVTIETLVNVLLAKSVEEPISIINSADLEQTKTCDATN